jgi:hypothetical protein
LRWRARDPGVRKGARIGYRDAGVMNGARAGLDADVSIALAYTVGCIRAGGSAGMYLILAKFTYIKLKFLVGLFENVN